YQTGVATGTLNFFRLLGGAIVVAGFGAIVLGNDAAGGLLTHGSALGGAAPAAGRAAADFSAVFVAACACLSASFAALLLVDERPLRGLGGLDAARGPDSAGQKP